MDIFRKRTTPAILSLKMDRYKGQFLKRLGTLLIEGYSLKESLNFLGVIEQPQIGNWIETILSQLEKGRTLHEALNDLSFPEKVVSQIYFSTVHGSFPETIQLCGKQLLNTVEKKKKLFQVIHYPFILVGFLFGMLIAMRYLMLPHIEYIVQAGSNEQTTGVDLIINLVYSAPYWMVGIGIFIVCFVGVAHLFLKKKTMVQKISIYSRIPILKPFLQLYWTQFFTFEWSQLLKTGCKFKEIITIMQSKNSSPLLIEMSSWIEQEMNSGKTFQEALAPFIFLKKEVGEIIAHGEMSSSLGPELMLYASECEEELSLKIERFVERLQPMIFIIVAIMIIAMYAALLMPTFSLMEGFK